MFNCNSCVHYLADSSCDFSFYQSLTFKEKMTSLKFKEKPTDLETKNYKFLLLSLVKLIHADPKLLLCVSIAYSSCIVRFTFEGAT